MVAAATAALGLVIGAVIGGFGGGGGVLTVPALVYLLGRSAQEATAGSVVIVGVASLVGALARLRGGIDWRTGIGFGTVGIPAALLGTALNHRVPQPVLLLAFAALTVLAATAMLLDRRGGTDAARPEPPGHGSAIGLSTRRRVTTVAKVVVCGAAVGFLTGFLGVGGGFLVVPALVIALHLPMDLAVGTSLLVIAANSAASAVSRIGATQLDWTVIAPFALAAVVGTVLGKRVAGKLSGAVLQTAFAVMLLAVGVFVGVESVAAL
jgi:uncharacterized membrane protein YfcA